MKSKSFLSGIFSVVSFILIANLAIPSTFAQCPPDISGTWVYKGVRVNECCIDPSKNGTHIQRGSIVVAQEGNEISASWIDSAGDPDVLTGIVNGNSVYVKIESTCGWVDHRVGIIKGNRINGFSTGEQTSCSSACKWHEKFRVKIVK